MAVERVAGEVERRAGLADHLVHDLADALGAVEDREVVDFAERTGRGRDDLRQLLGELEEREEIARLLDSARGAQAAQIFIGAENKLFTLSGSSVIAAPYRGKKGRVVGVVGVIGPTRLNYARVVPMVDFTAQALTRLMT